MNPTAVRTVPIGICIGLLAFFLAASLFAQDQDAVKRELFREVTAALQKAQQEDVPSFAPTLSTPQPPSATASRAART